MAYLISARRSLLLRATVPAGYQAIVYNGVPVTLNGIPIYGRLS
jgi:hypothetical protein